MRSSPVAPMAIFMAASARFCQSNSTTSLIPTSMLAKYSGIEENSVRITTGRLSPVWDMPSQQDADTASATKERLTTERRPLLRELLGNGVGAADQTDAIVRSVATYTRSWPYFTRSAATASR